MSDPGYFLLSDLFISNNNTNPTVFDNDCASQNIGTDFCIISGS